MSMKKLKAMFVFLLCVTFIYGESSTPEFESLSPQKKVDTLLAEYADNKYFFRNFSYQRKGRIIASDHDTLPYIFTLMKKYDAHPLNSGTYEIKILDDLVGYFFFEFKKLNDVELKELTVIYTDLLDIYLRTYKKIDAMAVFLEMSLTKMNSEKDMPFITLKAIERMHKRYIELGYEGLTIDYEELVGEYGLK